MNGAARGLKPLACTLSIFGVIAGAPAQAELIGLWDVFAPASAHLVSGGGGAFFDWLNAVNAPVTIEEAFTGPGFSRDTVVELGYGEGLLRNGPGADLVLFDARFDANSFSVWTSFDDFESELFLLAPMFVHTGETLRYYYGGFDLPYTASIWGAAFDLSALGVPEGASVHAIRVRSLEDDGGDLIGVGAIQDIAEPSMLALLLAGAACAATRRHRVGSRLRPRARYPGASAPP
jgi:hypothetical protein